MSMINRVDSAKRALKVVALAMMAVLGLGLSMPGAAEEKRSYVLATATVGGTYYPVGVALTTLIKVKLQSVHGIDMSAIDTAGSTENIHLLQDNKAQFAILSGLIGYYAWTGKGPFTADGPQTQLRSVTTLWQEPGHFVVKRRYAETGTIEDMKNLKGKKVSLGLKGSGTIELSRLLLGNLGIDIDREMELVYLGYDASAEALQKGWIEAMSAPAGVPVTAVTRAKTALGNDLVILEFTDAQLKKADSGLGLWTRYIIPAGTYPSQYTDINTVATLSFLAVRADIDEDAVYQITKAIYENLPFLQIIHGALSATSLEKAVAGLPMPLHPGALRYYKEIGLDIPAELIVE